MKVFIGLLVVGIIVVVFHPWFLTHEIIGGDWPYYFVEVVREKVFPPPLWVFWQNNGLGGIDPIRGLHAFESFVAVVGVQWFGLPWSVVYKTGWFGLFILLSFISPIVLARTIFPRLWLSETVVLSGLLYTTNTYILMIVGGGQMGVALAYSMAPLVLASFIKITYSSSVKNLAIAGMILGFQIMIDARIAYVTMVGVSMVVVISLVSYFVNKKVRFFQTALLSLLCFGVAVGIAALINAFWIVPMILLRYDPLSSSPDALSSITSLKFFSFADFSHALSLLHPNWPENIFGKIYFLQPEFLVLTVLAFASFLRIGQKAISNKLNTRLMFTVSCPFFVSLALVGAFLAKGVNPPFGEVYGWLFEHVPGFVMFRDPTKWYVLIAISYSVLIPFTLNQLAELRIRGKTLLIILFMLFWLFTIRQAVLGKLGGTFVRRSVPGEYVVWRDMIVRDTSFSRSLWVPRQSRFTFASSVHPAMEAMPLFQATSSASLIDQLHSPSLSSKLTGLSIRYVIVPSDPLGEIFIDDRRFSDEERQIFVDGLDRIPWLQKLPFKMLTVYEVTSY